MCARCTQDSPLAFVIVRIHRASSLHNGFWSQIFSRLEVHSLRVLSKFPTCVGCLSAAFSQLHEHYCSRHHVPSLKHTTVKRCSRARRHLPKVAARCPQKHQKSQHNRSQISPRHLLPTLGLGRCPSPDGSWWNLSWRKTYTEVLQWCFGLLGHILLPLRERAQEGRMSLRQCPYACICCLLRVRHGAYKCGCK